MAHGDFSDIKTLLEWLPEIPVVKNIEKELPEHLAQLSTRSSPNLPEGEIKTSFKFRAYQLANFHSRLPGVSRIDDFTTETSSNNISGAFSDYSLSGLAVVADWINNTRIHASCRK
jgi:D-aminopeptidase